MNAAQRDQVIGRRLARNGASRLLREAEVVPTSHERIARYRAERAHMDGFDTLSEAARTRKGLLYQRRLRRRPSRFAIAGVQPARTAAVVDSAADSRSPQLPATGQQPSIPRKRAKRKPTAQAPDNDAPPFNDAPDPEEAPATYADIRGT